MVKLWNICELFKVVHVLFVHEIIYTFSTRRLKWQLHVRNIIYLELSL